jgi:hypothetical protein
VVVGAISDDSGNLDICCRNHYRHCHLSAEEEKGGKTIKIKIPREIGRDAENNKKPLKYENDTA